jgi:hypothetical protein
MRALKTKTCARPCDKVTVPGSITGNNRIARNKNPGVPGINNIRRLIKIQPHSPIADRRAAVIRDRNAHNITAAPDIGCYQTGSLGENTLHECRHIQKYR